MVEPKAPFPPGSGLSAYTGVEQEAFLSAPSTNRKICCLTPAHAGRTQMQPSLLDLVDQTTGALREPTCPHGVSQRNGGWSFEPASRLWVHADPECRLSKHRTAQEPEMPKIVRDATPPPVPAGDPSPGADCDCAGDGDFHPVGSGGCTQIDFTLPTRIIDLVEGTVELGGGGWGKLPPLPDSAYPPGAVPIPEAPPLPWWEQAVWPLAPFMLCVDPGDDSCGVAFFDEDLESEHRFVVFLAAEMPPDDLTDMLAWLIIQGRLHTVVYERFRLYADKSKEQTGSEFGTSQLIGVIRWMVRKQNEHAELHFRVAGTGTKLTCLVDSGCAGRLPQPVQLIGQMADIKKATRGILRFKGIKSWALLHRREVHQGGRRACAKEHCHAVDAELHGWHWLLKGRPLDIVERPRVDMRHAQVAGYTGGPDQEEDA